MFDALFYAPEIQREATRFVMNETESNHAVKVLRMAAGEKLTLIDGCGSAFDAVILNPHAKRCEVEIIDHQDGVGKRDYHLHIAFAPTKLNERTEWFLEKATEIGVDEFTPLLTCHSERKELKKERMEKIIVSAMKQSHKAYLPVLNDMMSFSSFMEKTRQEGVQKFIAHCHSGEKMKLKDAKPHVDTVVMIGPEGDFSQEEVDNALDNGFLACSLGESRLRTETAAIVACHTICLLNE